MRTSTVQSRAKLSLIERQKNKNLDGEYISRVLRFSSDSRLVQGLADRVWACSQYENLYTANDLHTSDGELYEGRGQLWACNSRLCPACTGRLGKRNRRIARYVFTQEKVYLGEHWYFVTFTMPDLSLKDLPLLTCRSVINDAWRKFSRSKFFKDICRGGFKNEEFTVGDFGQYHYHIHSLAICRSRIQSDSFHEIRYHWTKALEFSFQKHNLKFECNTSDGYAVVNVQKVWNKDRSINELCKYITKTTDWAKIPSEQLADIATIDRFPRMFEKFGVCKDTAKEMRPEARETPGTETYLDTKKITVWMLVLICYEFNVFLLPLLLLKKISVNSETEKSDAPKKKKPTWRELCRILSRKEWLEYLENEISKVQDYRRRQLREKFAFASFRTLDGKTF